MKKNSSKIINMDQNYWANHPHKALKGYNGNISVFTNAMKSYPERLSEEQFLNETRNEFIRFLPSLPLHPGSKNHFFNQLMPTLATMAAAFVVLRKHGYSVEQIGRLEYEGYLQKFNKIPGIFRFLIKILMASPLFSIVLRSVTRMMSESGLDYTFFLEYRFQKNPCKGTQMKCTQCAMIIFMESNGLSEMKKLCNVFDFAQAESFGLGVKQFSNIGAGDKTCEYLLTPDKKDTVLPENIQEIKNVSLSFI